MHKTTARFSTLLEAPQQVPTSEDEYFGCTGADTCMHVFTYVRIYVCICQWVAGCICACHACLFLIHLPPSSLSLSLHVYIYICICIYTYIYIYVYTLTHTQTHAHTYTSTYKHTYIPTYLPTDRPTYLHTCMSVQSCNMQAVNARKRRKSMLTDSVCKRFRVSRQGMPRPRIRTLS